MTLIIDCTVQDTRSFDRNLNGTLSTDGITFLGQNIDDQYFSGIIQQLKIINGPEEAYEICKHHMPNCSEPFMNYQDDGPVSIFCV